MIDQALKDALLADLAALRKRSASTNFAAIDALTAKVAAAPANATPIALVLSGTMQIDAAGALTNLTITGVPA